MWSQAFWLPTRRREPRYRQKQQSADVTKPPEIAFLHQSSSVDDPEPRYREALNRVVFINYFDRLPDVINIFRQFIADDRRADQRAFIELDKRVDIRDILLEARMKRHMMPIDGKYFAVATGFLPPHVCGKCLILTTALTITDGPMRRAAFGAAPEQK